MIDLVPGAAVAGRVLFQDVDVFDRRNSIAELRRRVGMIFQKPVPFPLSIRANIQLGLKEHGVRNRRDREAMMEQVLRDVGLWDEVSDRLDCLATKLSGGQQQRLCLARALALDPDVLLLDEPCSALDPVAAACVEKLITELSRNRAIAIVTHNLAQARRIADDLAVFWVRDGSGTVIAQGTAEEIFSRPPCPTVSDYLSGRTG